MTCIPPPIKILHGCFPTQNNAKSPPMRSIAAALVAAAALVCASAGPVVSTTLGQVEGYTNELANVWSKIPYAAPPVGQLRWKPPQAHASWSDVLTTTSGENLVQCTWQRVLSTPALSAHLRKRTGSAFPFKHRSSRVPSGLWPTPSYLPTSAERCVVVGCRNARCGAHGRSRTLSQRIACT